MSGSKEDPQQEKPTISIPIGQHKSDEWNERKAVQLLKRAIIHYQKGIKNSSKAAGLDALSNIPTWLVAATQPFSPAIATSAALGAGLVTGICTETYLHGARLNRCLGLLEKYEDNVANIGKDAAATQLEKDVHKEGLLFEGIPNYKLESEYKPSTIKSLIQMRSLFVNKERLKARIKAVGYNLRHHPAESLTNLAKNISTSPFYIGERLIKTTATILKSSIEITNPKSSGKIIEGLKNVPKVATEFKVFSNKPRGEMELKDAIYNLHFTSISELSDKAIKSARKLYPKILDINQMLCAAMVTPECYISAANKISDAPSKIIKSLSPFKESPKYSVEQKIFFEQVKNGEVDEHIESGIIPAWFVEEVKTSKASLKNAIGETKGEAIKVSAEAGFTASHAYELSNTLDIGNIGEGFQQVAQSGYTDWDALATSDNIVAATNTYSILMAWEPFAHMSSRLTELYGVITGKTAKELEHYDQMIDYHDQIIAQRQNKEPEDSIPS